MQTSERIEQAIRDRFPNETEDSTEIHGVSTLYIKPEAICDVCLFLKESQSLDFDYLMSLTAVDWTDRIDVVYHLYSIREKHYVTLKSKIDRNNPSIESVTGIWKAANWQEREAYDMFGIKFEGHPDLRRILLEETWEGYPLRKDFIEENTAAGEQPSGGGQCPIS